MAQANSHFLNALNSSHSGGFLKPVPEASQGVWLQDVSGYVQTFLLSESEMSNSLFSLHPLPTDGVFGRCHKVPVMDTYHYEVSPGALQHLKVTLQKLSRTGRGGWMWAEAFFPEHLGSGH
jgi:hypothetical protein